MRTGQEIFSYLNVSNGCGKENSSSNDCFHPQNNKMTKSPNIELIVIREAEEIIFLYLILTCAYLNKDDYAHGQLPQPCLP